MSRTQKKFKVYVEVGKKRAFAGAVEWPGWCRGGRDEDAALQSLFEYAPRYARAIAPAKLGFQAPADASELVVIEQLKGDTTTDFGSPGIPPSSDSRPVDDAELERLQALLKACWKTFDGVVKKAAGKELRKGPRGGGRDLDKIVAHMVDGEGYYLNALGGKHERGEGDNPSKRTASIRKSILNTLAASARGEVPARGPRGGLRWTPRYFIRRDAWHILDHAWEIEDRLE